MTALDDFLTRRKADRAKKREGEKLDKRVERAYYATCSGIQIDIMDIGKVFACGRDALRQTPELTDDELGRLVRAYVEIIRKN